VWKSQVGENCTGVLDVAVVEEEDLFMDSFCTSDSGEADWIGKAFRALFSAGWLQGSWSEKATRQIPASIAANLASIAHIEHIPLLLILNIILIFPCRLSNQFFIILRS